MRKFTHTLLSEIIIRKFQKIAFNFKKCQDEVKYLTKNNNYDVV